MWAKTVMLLKLLQDSQWFQWLGFHMWPVCKVGITLTNFLLCVYADDTYASASCLDPVLARGK